MNDLTITAEFCRELRKARNGFLDRVEEARPGLYRYCRSLTGNPWDAEDLAQETLTRAFTRLATRSLLAEIERPRAWLLRIATNAWIDDRRREGRVVAGEDLDPPAEEAPPAGPEVSEALLRLATALPPRERCAVLLADVFDLNLAETARSLEVSVGAVKAALHRGRAKLREARPTPAPAARAVAGGPLLEAFVAAFNARDIEKLMALFAADATAEIVGCLDEPDPASIRDGSMAHTLFDPDGAPLPDGDPGAACVEIGGETMIVLRYRVEEEGGTIDAIRDVLRFREEGGRIRRLRWYYFSPEVLDEVGGILEEPSRDNGYRY